ncbi:FHA domain-containing protein [Zavarzinella formosa]|uniref:FHA domain-containing protein n=1 Tax=Zavarzinella formosa TaxID=360055 RepID=UPI0002F291DB|nr:FHA domain-containing protein [Zavarzinella formosa]
MKLSLVVAQGVHSGKSIPITVPDFVIGRDPQCQLRPASPAVSKQHCGIAQRDGKVFVRDCGSTNGTFVNDEQVGGDREVQNGDKLKVGPLEFVIRLEVSVTVKPAPKKAPSTNDTVLNEATLIEAPKLAPKTSEPVQPKAAPKAPEPVQPTPPAPAVASGESGEDEDSLAAMMLGMDDGPSTATPTIGAFNPDSTTVMEMPALGAKPAEAAPKEEKKKANTQDSSNAAAELLSKYMRRPRT